MFERQPATAQDVVRQLEAKYDQLIASGTKQPFLYPWGTIGAAVVLLYLLVDHRSSPTLQRLRYPVFAFICVFSIYCILYTRALNPAAAFGVGLISAWAILWCAVLLIWHDPQTDFKRIERQGDSAEQYASAKSSTQALSVTGTEQNGNGSTPNIRQRSKDGVQGQSVDSKQTPARRKGKLAWQSYPISPFIERLDWVADIFCNFRGMGWDWRISGLPAPPLHVQQELASTSGTPVSSDDTHRNVSGTVRHHTRESLLRESVYVFARNYLILDVLKTLIAHDPYFWGVSDERPPGYLPATLQNSPVVIRSSRLLISLAAVYIALEFIFSLGPLFFVGVLGPDLIGARGEPWMYPSAFGGFSSVLDKGLAGWWGGWWHQTFRYAFEAPGSAAVKALKLHPKSQAGKFVQLCIAFALSGFLHASGSYTQIGETRPLTGPFTFFLLQIVGVSAQVWALVGLKRIGVAQRTPRWLARTINFVYVHVWMYYTAPLLVEDFARGGVWLFEPIPISPLRGLGLGSPHDGFWQWGGQPLRWHRGNNWWNTGIGL